MTRIKAVEWHQQQAADLFYRIGLLLRKFDVHEATLPHPLAALRRTGDHGERRRGIVLCCCTLDVILRDQHCAAAILDFGMRRVVSLIRRTG
jgi:hypothetical protein